MKAVSCDDGLLAKCSLSGLRTIFTFTACDDRQVCFAFLGCGAKDSVWSNLGSIEERNILMDVHVLIL
jgi:hypothetical protein